MTREMERDPRRAFRLLFSLLACLAFCSAVFASGEHEAAGNEALMDLFKRILNFVLLLVILFWAIKKSGVMGFFTSRTEEISQKIEQLQKEKKEAESKYRDAEQKIRQFEKHRKDIIEELKAEGLAEKEKIIAEAQERVKNIIEQAELSIEQEMQSAKERLKGDVVDLAAQKAQEIISRELTDTDQDHLVDEFIERVGKLH